MEKSLGIIQYLGNKRGGMGAGWVILHERGRVNKHVE
jgi:hypothetical protein